MSVAREPSPEAMEAYRAHRTPTATLRRFRVVGNRKVAGAVKGEEVVMLATPEQAQHLIDTGHVIPLPAEHENQHWAETADIPDQPETASEKDLTSEPAVNAGATRRPSTARKAK